MSLINRRLAANATWNLVGQLAPMVAALVSIPILLSEIGVERFGVLTMAWVLIGYFGVFDLGLGRSLTKLAAERIGTASEGEVPALTWTALALMAMFSLLPSIGLLLWNKAIVGALNVEQSLSNEAQQSFMILGATIPLVIVTAGLRGVLEAYQAFGLVNIIRIPTSIFNYIGPVLVLPFATDLPNVILTLAAGRVVGFIAHLGVCLWAFPTLREFRLNSSLVPELLRFGGWMTLTNILSPLMVYMDRFLIGAMLSATAVAYYSTPYEMISKLQIIPAALVSVLFPVFSSAISRNRGDAADLYVRSIGYVIVALFPVVLIFVVFSSEILDIWLGGDFARESQFVLQVLAIAQLINGVARVPFALVQAAGRPAITALFHFAEFLLYVPLLYTLMHVHGIRGVAAAFIIRVTIDLALLFWAASHYLARSCLREILLLSGACIILGIAAIPSGLSGKLIFVGAIVSPIVYIAWTICRGERKRAILSER